MIVKSQQEMTQRILGSLQNRVGVNATGAGTLAQTLTEVLVEEFHDFYDELNLVNAMAFLSTSEGGYVDLIGQLVDCAREVGESDLAYKERMRRQVYRVAGGNLTAIRLEALKVIGVADITFEEYSDGPGSFTCYVYGDGNAEMRLLVNDVAANIERVKAYGVSVSVKTPVERAVSIAIDMAFKEGTGPSEQALLKEQARSSVIGYINGLGRGDALIVNEVIEQVMQVSEKVLDLDIKDMRLDGRSRYVSNVLPGTNERFVVENVEVG